ncbi:MAG: hypothetical protein G8345_04390 [Magnetococcales bacterium]|nr:hypothetical protein [Magnetococcales bacterium]NGZ26110.1 hypothetical protein [Magnetococcales bacterium]
MNNLLDEIEKDILRESLNLGVGRAAAALSELIGHEVEIYLPELDLMAKRAAVDLLSEIFCQTQWAIQQYFHDTENPAKLSGHIFLFLRDHGQTTPIHGLIQGMEEADKLTVSEMDIFQELGNILLHACLSGLADLLALELTGQTPTVHRTDLRPLLLNIVRQKVGGTSNQTFHQERRRHPPQQDPVIQILLHFNTPGATLEGSMMIFLDLITMPFLKQQLQSIASQYG